MFLIVNYLVMESEFNSLIICVQERSCFRRYMLEATVKQSTACSCHATWRQRFLCDLV